MVSLGPISEAYNYTHMYSFEDLQPVGQSKLCVNPNSLFGVIYKDKNFSKFKTIIERAGMVGQLDELEANFTLLAPEDKYLKHIPSDFFTYMDDGLARQILGASLINRKIGSKLLKSSPVAYYYTKNFDMRMYITNIRGETRVNETCKIVKFDICCDNGLLHVIDGLIVPTEQHFLN